MKKKVTGIISLITATGLILTVLNELVKENWRYIDISTIFLIIAILIGLVSVILYVLWTNFGQIKNTEIEKIDYEIKLLKRKIERKELSKKLEEK